MRKLISMVIALLCCVFLYANSSTDPLKTNDNTETVIATTICDPPPLLVVNNYYVADTNICASNDPFYRTAGLYLAINESKAYEKECQPLVTTNNNTNDNMSIDDDNNTGNVTGKQNTEEHSQGPGIV